MYKEKITPEKVASFYHNQGLDPASAWLVTTFFHEEVKKFDEATKALEKRYPNLHDRLEDLRIKMYLPADCALEFMGNLETTMQSVIGERAGLALMMQTRDIDNSSKLKLEFLKAREKRIKFWEDLIEEAGTNIILYAKFVKEIFDGIGGYIKRNKGMPLEIAQKAMRDESFRNPLLKKALANRAWLLGYDLRIASKMGLQTARDNISRLEMYAQLGDSEKELLSSEEITMIFPLPLGPEKLGGKRLYEVVLPNLVKNDPLESYEAIEKAVRNHFDNRALQILIS